METAALIVSILALLVAGGAAWYTRGQKLAADRAVEEAVRSADGATRQPKVTPRFVGEDRTIATGPSPVDRGKTSSKHHLICDGGGVPLAVGLTGGNRNDITQLIPLLDAVPPVRGRRGRPRRKPDVRGGRQRQRPRQVPHRDWAGERVGLAFIPPGQPWRNGYIESFNGRLRDECLNITLFWSLTQAGS